METFKLAPQDREELEKVIKQRKVRYEEGLRALVLLSLDEGLKYEAIAQCCHISKGTISKYVKEYQGSRKLKNEVTGGSEGYLDEGQKQELVSHLKEKTYLKSDAIIDWIEKRYGVRYSRSGIYGVLKSLGFVYKKPKSCPGKLNAEQQKVFIEEYTALKKQLKKEEVLLFLDSVHPDHQT